MNRATGTENYDIQLLAALAHKHIWWKTPQEATRQPERIIAQVMDIGNYDDVQRLVAMVGEKSLRRVIINAEAGQFSERSWHYWHYRLGLAAPGRVPDMPKRSRQ
ncbi:hypothetical protein BMS3Bbin14_01505 [bacterium BMS3Bbin14]|nr:hypothetical protein BMS3Abin13_01330 [bacterium BMS3Abin13]GBE53023.1 hypothetical protein BMS3Bbin14_01505 [bacterium BMS3Bbin14]HDK42955.1 hypothetical protein [Desulfobacteraceae bacterium]HDO30901.1 hypothetical protein [Desulfobacteraceae bacterium]